jgi:cysteine-rich repeat protein
LLLKADRLGRLHLDEATRTGRARPTWAAGFAGSPGGFSGDGVAIAIIDTGLDGTHPDLAGRMIGWKDYTTEAEATPIDRRGHGSHVAGVALGSGAAFGVGPANLHYTDQGDLSATPAGGFVESPIHVGYVGQVGGGASITMTSTAQWASTGSGAAELDVLRQPDGATSAYAIVAGPLTGTSPLTKAFDVPAAPGTHLTVGLLQNAEKGVGVFTVTTSVADYPAVGDGFPAFRGVAANAGWFGAKVFKATGQATTSDIAAAMDDIVVRRSLLSIKIVNLSFGIESGDPDVTQRAKANTMVDNGLVVVASGGNNGPGVASGDPGRAAKVITVVASNDANALTDYSSRGSLAVSPDEDDKPDIVAPGGSLRTSRILSVDSNTADADGALPDAFPNDYASLHGTSLAAPFVAGSAALVVEALERSGVTWQFDSSASPFLVKALLLASATETNQDREDGGGNPLLGRSASPKDLYEGYGLVNPDAAIEATTIPYTDFTDSASGTPDGRRAWGRRVTLDHGRTARFNLTVPQTGDFDLYLYDSVPGPQGNPTLLAASDRAGLGVAEKLTYTAAKDSLLYLFVKRVSGTGTFSIDSTNFECGNGTLDPGEECDDGNVAKGDCCSPTCQLEQDGTSCDDGNVCTKTDTCVAGRCVGQAGIACLAPDECHVGLCNPASGACTIGVEPDGKPCSDGTCELGICRPKGAGLGDDQSLIPDSAGLFVGGGGCACRAEPVPSRDLEGAGMAAFAALVVGVRRRFIRFRRGGRV